MLLITLSIVSARADFDVCATWTSVTAGERIRPGQAVLVGMSYADYGSCSLEAWLYPAAGGEGTAVEGGIDSSDDGRSVNVWYPVPETLAPGDYRFVAGFDDLPVVIDDTLPLGVEPSPVTAALSLVESVDPVGGGPDYRACATLDVPAPGVTGWAVELEVGTLRSWVVVPAAGLAGHLACVPVTAADVADGETCVAVSTLDPFHATVAEWGPFCGTWPVETADTGTTGDTGASPATDTGSADTGSSTEGGAACGCASAGSGGLVAALVVPLVLLRQRTAARISASRRRRSSPR
jgi:hypothetical protein